MKKSIYILVAIAVLAYVYISEQQGFEPDIPSPRGAASAVQQAYEQRQSDVQVQGKGTVSRVLPDDNEGSRHQRFILELSPGHTLLVAHNIDLAPRIRNINKGDRIDFYGEYEWNSKGGVLHWTHHDPAGRHVDGWLKHKGRTYQ